MKSPRILRRRARSTATNSCGSGRCAATSTGGDWAWGCCSTAESPRGWACAPRWPRSGQPPTRPLPPATAGGVAAELVGLLASMALAVAARG